MYTKIEAITKLNTSKATLYKHMEKNGINKGNKLTEEDIKVLQKSMSKNQKVDSIRHLEKEYVYKTNKLEKEIEDLKIENEKLLFENRELIKQIQVSQMLVNKTQVQNVELVANNQKLIETKEKKSWWKK